MSINLANNFALKSLIHQHKSENSKSTPTPSSENSESTPTPNDSVVPNDVIVAGSSGISVGGMVARGGGASVGGMIAGGGGASVGGMVAGGVDGMVAGGGGASGVVQHGGFTGYHMFFKQSVATLNPSKDNLLLTTKTVAEAWKTLEPEQRDAYKEMAKAAVNGGRIYDCFLCRKTFARENLLRFHRKTCGQSFVCTEEGCAKSFKSDATLKRHKNEHAQTLICNFCNKSCTTKFNLERHVKRHVPKENRQQFACQTCQKVYASESSLKAHTKKFH